MDLKQVERDLEKQIYEEAAQRELAKKAMKKQTRKKNGNDDSTESPDDKILRILKEISSP